MFKIIAATAAISLFSTAASALTTESFLLDTSSAAGTDSTVVLEAGRAYDLTVSGTFYLGSNLSRHLADAEYFNLGGHPLDRVRSLEIGVGVDGRDIDFGAFSGSNTYTARIFGDGSTINVSFFDSFYGDNRGSLNVTLASIPLPAGILLLLSGLAGLGIASRRKA